MTTVSADKSRQANIIGALVIRELHSRFGRHNVGFLWVIGEPLLLAFVIGSLHAFQPAHIGSQMNPVAFAIIGYTIFIIFRGIFGRAESLLEANQTLLYHQMISILNLSVARVVVETAGCFCAMAILLGATISLGLCELPARPLYLLAAIGAMTLLAFGMGLIVTALSYERPTIGRLVHPVNYFMMPASGAFFAVDWLPPDWREIVLWNPMVIIFESGLFTSRKKA